MFSSLASFIFGSNTPATTNSEANHNPTGGVATLQDHNGHAQRLDDDDGEVCIDRENTIEVTSSTPSVTGARLNGSGNGNGNGNHNGGQQRQGGKRGKNKRNKAAANKSNKRQGAAASAPAQSRPTPSLTKLLTPSVALDEDIDIDDSDWCFVEKEVEEDDSLPHSDSEEELSIVEVKPNRAAAAVATLINADDGGNDSGTAQRRRQHITSHSLYSGPRPQQQRNYLQRTRNNGARGGALNISTLSPPRSIAGGSGAGPTAADGGITQSLYVVSNANANGCDCSDGRNEFGANMMMEESWFVTPPPCFTSIGPINMETSPFENLLIEHPSMSVYHSIRSAQEATESFVNLDLGVEKPENKRESAANAPAQNNRNTQAVQQQSRSSSARVDRFAAAQLKQELLARSTQKSLNKKERQSMCRGAMKRANMARDIQSKGKPQRRSDMQHCRIVSGANNNRKCCF